MQSIYVSDLPLALNKIIHEYYFPSYALNKDLLNDMFILWNFDAAPGDSKTLGWDRNGITFAKSNFVELIDGVPKSMLKHPDTLKIFDSRNAVMEDKSCESDDEPNEWDEMRATIRKLGKYYLQYMNTPVLYEEKIKIIWKEPCSEYVRPGKFRRAVPSRMDVFSYPDPRDTGNFKSPYDKELTPLNENRRDLSYEDQQRYDELLELERKWVLENDPEVIRISSREVSMIVDASAVHCSNSEDIQQLGVTDPHNTPRAQKYFTVQDLLSVVRNVFHGSMYHADNPRLREVPEIGQGSDGIPILRVAYMK